MSTLWLRKAMRLVQGINLTQTSDSHRPCLCTTLLKYPLLPKHIQSCHSQHHHRQHCQVESEGISKSTLEHNRLPSKLKVLFFFYWTIISSYLSSREYILEEGGCLRWEKPTFTLHYIVSNQFSTITELQVSSKFLINQI